ncbi:MAG: hypothetical protein R6V01_02730 [Thermoplasmatota archaeon]
MIRYLLLLYLGAVSVLLVDLNPLWASPLLLVAVSFLWDNKWAGLLGVLLFSIITLGRVDSADLTDLGDLSLMVIFVVLPEIVLLELVLSPRPYSFDRISFAPVLISASLILGFSLALFLLTRVQRIGVYLNSDPTLQVFILMALSIFFTGPILLGSRPADDRVGSRKRS